MFVFVPPFLCSISSSSSGAVDLSLALVTLPYAVVLLLLPSSYTLAPAALLWGEGALLAVSQ